MMILDIKDSVVNSPLSMVGGKAKNLANMRQLGLPVPEWLVVTTEAFVSFLTSNNLLSDVENLRGNIIDLDRASQQERLLNLQNKILQSEFSPELIASFKRAYESISDANNTFFAVRSSVADEDGAKDSFAGQMDSFLYQQGEVAILESIKKCFASAFNHRAIIYRLEKGIEVNNIRAAVIVQKMVASDISGVLFTANPINGNLKQCLVSATFGLGEGVVSGECVTDEFVVTHDLLKIEKNVNEKDQKIIFNAELKNGTKTVDLDHDQIHAQCISDEKLLELCKLTLNLADELRHPQDVEWAFEGNKLYVLQTRPVTSLAPSQDQSGNKIVFDNSNIQESYCGVTTPLTFSFASRAYATVYEQTMRAMGANSDVINDHQDMLQNMLGLIKGRVYYNINNWYRGLLLLPSFKTNKADMERMMGLQDPVDFIEGKELSLWQKIKKLPNLVRNLAKLLWEFKKLDVSVVNFLAMFRREYLAIDRSALHKETMQSLVEKSITLRERVLLKWETPIINDFYVMMMNGRVHRWLSKLDLDNPDLYQNNLLSGEEGIESTEPTKYLLKLTSLVREDKKLQDLFEAISNEELLGALKIANIDFYEKCLEYIELYGDRCMGELKLETQTLRTKPAFMFAVIKNYLKQPNLSIENLHAKEMHLRSSTEEEVFKLISKKLGLRKVAKFKSDLQKLRSAVKNRENMRLARTRLFGLFRDIYMQLGTQMSLYGILELPRDIFYLTVEEIEHLYSGTSVQKDLKPLVVARKEEFSQYEKEDLPHHFSTQGLVYYHNAYEYNSGEEIDDNADKLSGTGCYPGIVEGKIKLIFSPEDELDLNGQILCTVRTDPGWAPLFPTAGGILVERGSTLSHSAVVARELGIPAIVGIKGLTSILKNNEDVKMDGAKGTIERKQID